MKKNIVQDVVFPKRSIRDVTVPSRRREGTSIISKPKTRQVEEIHVEQEENSDDNILHRRIPSQNHHTPYTFEYNNDTPQKESRIGLWISLAIFLIALGFGISTLFVSAKVTIIPKTQTIPIDVSLSAPKDRPSGEFGYQVVSISSVVEKVVPAGAVQKVEKKASGTIIVYNNTSDTAQKLIANTRFESSDGKIFRISNPITIPGRKTENGKTVPGSVEAVVTADQAGESYNLDLVDFTVPGLKGDPRYTTIYARSKTPMTGGFSGEMKVVDSTIEKNTQEELQVSLKEKLKNEISAQIPVGFILFNDALSYQIGSVSQKSGTDGSEAVLELKGTANAIIFDSMLLSKAIVNVAKNPNLTEGQSVSIVNLKDLSFVLTGLNQVNQDITTPINFTLTGDAQFEWLYDESILKNDLLGIKKTDLSALLQAKYPSIDSAKVQIRPIWKRSFPIDPSKVTIIKFTVKD
ncbi:MAG: baseplate J/gp47 family protein [Minisyncoccota bacterium]